MEQVVVRRVSPIPGTIEEILRTLPEWFGIEEALADYVEQAHVLPTYAALLNDRTVGACLVKHHTDLSAEVFLLAVHRRYHRQGFGRRMLGHVEADLIRSGSGYLQVKTLGPSHPSTEYAATRHFYESLGFVGLEELDDLWPDNPCLIMVKHLCT